MAYLRQIFTKIYRASNAFSKIIRANQFLEKTKTRFTVDYTPGAFALEGFDVTGVGNDITLEWIARAEFDNYRVYRSSDNQTFTMIVELGVGVEMYQDNNLTQDTYYYYVVGVLPSGFESLKTDTISVFANEPPGDPVNLAVVAENEQAVLTWDAVDDSNLLEYILYLDGVEVDRTTQTQFTFTGLTNGQQYTFGVQAIDDLSATSGVSDIIDTVADTIAPAIPTGLSVDGADTVADLSWNANSEPDLAGYNVYVDGVKDNGSIVTGTSYQATGLTNNTTVDFQVSAVDGDGNESGLSDIVSEFIEDTVAPAAPVNFTVNDLNGIADLFWDASADGDFKESRVYLDGVFQGVTTSTTFQITGLTVGQQYTYEVSHVDTSDNESSKAQVVSVMADDIAPAAPTGLVAVGENEVADLSWNANSEPDLAGYNVYVNGVKDNGSVITATSYQVTGLTNGASYDFQVSAVDDFDNESPLSAIVSEVIEDTLAPATPTGLTVIPGDTVLDCSWSANSEPDLAGYNVYVNGVKDNGSVITATSYQVTGLTNGVSYDIQVSAIDTSDNESLLSAIVSGTPVVLLAESVGLGVATNGIDQYIDTNQTSYSFFGVAFTIEFYFKTTSTTKSTLLGSVNDGFTTFLQIFINANASQTESADNLVIVFRDDLSNAKTFGTNSPPKSLTDGNMHHLAFTFTEVNDVNLYVDGEKAPLSQASNDTIDPASFVDFENNLTIGARNLRGVIDSFFDGLIHEVRIWDVEKTETQIQNLINSDLVGNETNLVNFYKFSENAGNLTKDAVSGIDGDLVGNTDNIMWSDVSKKTSALFDTDFEQIIINKDVFGGLSEFTIECWFRETSTGSRRGIISNFLSTASVHHLLRSDEGQIQFFLRNAADDQFSVSYNPTTTLVWHHVAVTVSHINNEIKLYVDGVERDSTIITGNPKNPSQERTVLGGEEPSTASSLFFKGYIDDVRFWDDVRTQIEIQTLRKNSLTGGETNLLHYYNFDDKAPWKAIDSAGSEDGDIINSIYVPVDGTYSVISDNTLITNGVDQAANIGAEDIASELANNITVEFWFRTSDTSLQRVLGVTEDIGKTLFVIHINADETDLNVPGKVQLIIRDEIGNIMKRAFSSAQTINDNKWHHLAISKAQNKDTKMYLDGLEVPVAIGENLTPNTFNPSLTYPIYFGAGNVRDVSLSTPFTGMLKDLRIWKIIRNKWEIRDFYQNLLQGDEDNLMHYYKFNEGSGDVFTDTVTGATKTLIGNVSDNMWGQV